MEGYENPHKRVLMTPEQKRDNLRAAQKRWYLEHKEEAKEKSKRNYHTKIKQEKKELMEQLEQYKAFYEKYNPIISQLMVV